MEKYNVKPLLRKIWITRKCRIETSERLNKKDEDFQKLSVYYSILIVALSIWNIQIKDNTLKDTSSLVILIISIVVALFSMFITSKNYKERYFDLKMNYIELNNLYNELLIIDNDNDSNNYKCNICKIEDISRRYNELLKYVENHSTYDYLKIMYNDSDERKELTKRNVLCLYINIILEYTIKIFFFVIPLVVIFLVIKYYN